MSLVSLSTHDVVEYRPSMDIQHPLPNEFDVYLPWACKQLEVQKLVMVTRKVQEEYESVHHQKAHKEGQRLKIGKSYTSLTTMRTTPADKHKPDKISQMSLPDPMHLEEDYVIINAIYTGEHLVHIKFNRDATEIPAAIITIIGYIIPFYPHVYKLTINNGLNVNVMKEVSKLLSLSNITEIIFDDCAVDDAIKHIFQEQQHQLVHLSLSRCQITDNVVRTIAEQLVPPLLASKKLSILNLSSNHISDVGASYLALALRTNRKLKYLNLSDNVLTDKGTELIFRVLKDFPLTYNEHISVKDKYFKYAKEKNKIIMELIDDFKASGEYDRVKNLINQPDKSRSLKGKKSNITGPDLSTRSLTEINNYFYSKADNLARSFYGEFKDPFDKNNTVSKNGLLYAKGNNTLCYLNLAFNELTYISLKLILEVLLHQNALHRSPVGLINLRLEGNPMPKHCRELCEIGELLGERLLPVFKRTMSKIDRKKSIKSK